MSVADTNAAAFFSFCDGDTTTTSGTARLVAATDIADAFCSPCVAGSTYGPADGSLDCLAVTAQTAIDCAGMTIVGGSIPRLVTSATADYVCTGCVAGTTWGSATTGDCTAVTVCDGFQANRGLARVVVSSFFFI